MYILDTDHIGIIQRKSEPAYSRAQHPPTDFFVTVVSFHEEVLGWNAYIQKAKKLAGVVKGYDKFQKILADFARSQVLPFEFA